MRTSLKYRLAATGFLAATCLGSCARKIVYIDPIHSEKDELRITPQENVREYDENESSKIEDLKEDTSDKYRVSSFN